MPDQIIVKADKSTSYTPCPTGSQLAVCVDVIDLGWTTDQYEDQPVRIVRKAALVFQTDEENPETGKRWEPSIEFVIGQRFEDGREVTTFGKRAKLRKFLNGWRGKDYTEEEAAQGAPLHKLVGVNAMLNIMHRESKSTGNTYAVIDSAAMPHKSLPKIVPFNYERSEHWTRRKEEYAEKLAKYEADHPAAQSLDEMPAALQDDDADSLPF